MRDAKQRRLRKEHPATTKEEFAQLPYAQWLDDTMMQLLEINPVCITINAITDDGEVLSGYWNCNANSRAIIMDAMRNDSLLEYIEDNKDTILEILNGEEEDEDEYNETDTEPDRPG